MNRRLRKKLHLGEFREDGFEVRFGVDPWVGSGSTELFLDQWLAFLEENDLGFGGVSNSNTGEFKGMVAGAKRSANEWDVRSVVCWLERQGPHIREIHLGPLRDVWHDPEWSSPRWWKRRRRFRRG